MISLFDKYYNIMIYLINNLDGYYSLYIDNNCIYDSYNHSRLYKKDYIINCINNKVSSVLSRIFKYDNALFSLEIIENFNTTKDKLDVIDQTNYIDKFTKEEILNIVENTTSNFDSYLLYDINKKYYLNRIYNSEFNHNCEFCSYDIVAINLKDKTSKMYNSPIGFEFGIIKNFILVGYINVIINNSSIDILKELYEKKIKY